jgi:hypothetical protein
VNSVKTKNKRKKSMKTALESMALRRRLDEFTYLTTGKLLKEEDLETALEIQRNWSETELCKEQACYLKRYKEEHCYLHTMKFQRQEWEKMDENDSKRVPLIKAKGQQVRSR